MICRKQIHNLTLSDQSLISMFSDYTLGEPDFSGLSLPLIEMDSSYLPPQLLENVWTENIKDEDQWRSENESPFDTDQMGAYNPDDHSIILFDKAISAISRMLGIQKDTVRALTIIHFLSHFTIQCPADSLHLGWKESLTRLNDLLTSKGIDSSRIMMNYHIASSEYFRKCSKEYIVSAAQVQTYLIVKRNEKYLQAFMRIADHQSKAYNRFREFKNFDIFELRRMMSLVREVEYMNKLFSDTQPLYVDKSNIDIILEYCNSSAEPTFP